MNSHRYSNRKSKIIFKIGRFLILIFFTWFLWSKSNLVFYARNLECYTQYGSCPPRIIGSVKWLLNTPLLKSLPQKEVENDLRQFPEIKTIHLYRRLPRTLVLSLEIRKPAVLIGPRVLGAHVAADDEGVILYQSENPGLPLLLFSDLVKPGSVLNADQINAIKILDQMSGLPDNRLIGKIDNHILSVFFPQNVTVLLDLSQMTSNWYTTLQVILTRSKIQSKMPKVIDLRFNSPIVTF